MGLAGPGTLSVFPVRRALPRWVAQGTSSARAGATRRIRTSRVRLMDSSFDAPRRMLFPPLRGDGPSPGARIAAERRRIAFDAERRTRLLLRRCRPLVEPHLERF